MQEPPGDTVDDDVPTIKATPIPRAPAGPRDEVKTVETPPPTPAPRRGSGPRPPSGGSRALSSRARSGLPGAEDGPIEVGQYEILRELGRGGMGVVYKARHRALNREVALKVMLAEQASEQETRRFLREAEACAQLKHPHIVPVYEIDQHEGKHYFAMEFVEGQTLLEWGKKARRPVEAIVEIMVKVCEAIAYAHQRGIIHRDLKPHNVMVDASGEPKVMDFGLAKRTDGAKTISGAEKTVVGTIMGTPQYMPPEQATGKVDEVDTRSDVYALGVILYELVAGELPLNAETLQELLFKIEFVDPVPLRQKRPDVPWEVEVIAAKALRKEKSARFQSAQEMADDLGRWVRKEPIQARRASLVYRGRKFIQRNRVLSAVAATVLVAAAAGGWFAAREARKSVLGAAEKVGALTRALGAFEESRAKLATAAALAELEAMAQSVAAAEFALQEAQSARQDAERVRELGYDFQRDEDRHKRFLGEYRVRKAEEEAADQDRAQAAGLVAEAKAKREDAEKLKIAGRKDAEAVDDALDKANQLLLAATRLDPKNPNVEGELGRVLAAQLAVAEAGRREGEREDFEAALASGRKKLEAARVLAAQRIYAEDEEAGPDEVGLKFQGAAGDFERALALRREDAEARRGLVDAVLEDGAIVVSEHQFLLARRLAAAPRVKDLAPERVKEFLAFVKREEVRFNDFEQLMARGRAARTREQFPDAKAEFERALRIDPENIEARLGFELCGARMVCASKRHEDELRQIEGAAAFAPGPEERADVETERARALDEIAFEARAALDRGDPERAERLCLLVITRRPGDAAARALRIEIAGRRNVRRGMVFVSAGRFRSSLDPSKDTEVAAFELGETEVTNAEFAEFVAAGGYERAEVVEKHWPAEARAALAAGAFRSRGDGRPGPAGWSAGRPLPGTDGLPVAGVSWYEASAYASWREARLPLEVEWEKAALHDPAAAGGTIATPWRPVGWDAIWAAYFDRVLDEPKPVKVPLGADERGARLDKAPCGADEIYGNVHEWVSDGAPEGRAVLRGGSFGTRNQERASPTRRYVTWRIFREDTTGFRIARSVQE